MKFNTILTAPYVDQLNQFAPGVEATLKDATILPFLRPAEKTLTDVVGDKTYAKIKERDNDDPLKTAIIAALCNLAMYNYKIWEVVQKRQVQKQDTFKYELQMMQSDYIDNYYSFVDSAIKLLEEKCGEFSEWESSAARKEINGLLLRDAAEFSSFYNIDKSHYFFFSSIFLQRKVLDKYITPAVVTTELDPAPLRRIKTVVAQLTVAFALRQFDYIALPKSIRDSRADGPSRSGAAEQSSVIDLSDYLFCEAEKDLAAILYEINKPAEGENIESLSELNDEKNKYYLMS